MQIIRALVEDCEDDTLASYLDAGASYVAQLVPEVADRIGRGVGAVASVERDAGRFYLFEAIARLFRNASSAEPLLLLFDDLHAADSSSLWLLRFLAPDLPASPLMVLGAYREGVGGLLERLSERVPSEEGVTVIHDITQGNPLFVQELVHTLRSDALDSPGRVTVPVPQSVRVVIDKRLAPLSADAVQVLSAAAVVGRAFHLSLLGAACDLPMQQVLGALSEATDLGVVTEELGTIGLYCFSHPLMREVVYERLPLRPGWSCTGGSARRSRPATGRRRGPIWPSSPITSPPSLLSGAAPRPWSTPTEPATGPWRCTPTRRRRAVRAGAAGPGVRRPPRSAPLRAPPAPWRSSEQGG